MLADDYSGLLVGVIWGFQESEVPAACKPGVNEYIAIEQSQKYDAKTHISMPHNQLTLLH